MSLIAPSMTLLSAESTFETGVTEPVKIVGHAEEYLRMHHDQIPRLTQSMIVCYILTECCLVFWFKILLLACPAIGTCDDMTDYITVFTSILESLYFKICDDNYFCKLSAKKKT